MQLMRRYAKLGNTLYINSIMMQKPNLTNGKEFIQKLIRKAKSIFRGLKKVDTGFWVYSPISLPVQHINWAKPLNETLLRLQIWQVIRKIEMHDPIIWVVCPTACDIAMKIRKSKMVYLRTDVYELFPNVDSKKIRNYDRKLKANADLTIFVSSKLFHEESNQCKKAFYLDHGVDYDMFASADEIPDRPSDMADIPRPIVGFFGGIASHTVDIGLLEKVVELSPNLSFVFVGKVSPKCAGLQNRRNVWMLGQRPYEQIPHYGKCFDMAIMPWKQNRWIQACNPIKLKEYLALGKPIVSTPFNELNKYLDVVYEAKTPQDFAQAIEKALAEDSPERISARRKKVESASWDSKVQQLFDNL